MPQMFGKAYVRVDGETLRTLPGASLDAGGMERSPVKGSQEVYGFSEAVLESTIECEIAIAAGDDPVALHNRITNATVTFECDTGQTYMVRQAFSATPPKMTEGGDGGKVPFKLIGQPAELA
ncbi:Phage tail tube protein [compost metagenome]